MIPLPSIVEEVWFSLNAHANNLYQVYIYPLLSELSEKQGKSGNHHNNETSISEYTLLGRPELITVVGSALYCPFFNPVVSYPCLIKVVLEVALCCQPSGHGHARLSTFTILNHPVPAHFLPGPVVPAILQKCTSVAEDEANLRFSRYRVRTSISDETGDIRSGKQAGAAAKLPLGSTLCCMVNAFCDSRNVT